MRKRTPALIFDFGNVVAHFDYRKACATFGRRLGLSGHAFLDLVRRRGFSTFVAQYESGQIDAETFHNDGGIAQLNLPRNLQIECGVGIVHEVNFLIADKGIRCFLHHIVTF